ncbi:hypothetical protein IWZ03DRAFT_23013 [Phyllosticta citriasiana]|uniref:Uncharacterized protein n=1 Tax=Phyllosticta citriasiana TaxID=595635 RepID=A0ABR1KZS7_9PEZI
MLDQAADQARSTWMLYRIRIIEHWIIIRVIMHSLATHDRGGGRTHGSCCFSGTRIILENIDRLGCFACLPAGDWLLPRRVSISLLVTGFYVLLMKNSVLSARYEDLAIRVRAVENFLYRSNDVENGFCKLRGRGEDCCRHTVSWSSLSRRKWSSIYLLIEVTQESLFGRASRL